VPEMKAQVVHVVPGRMRVRFPGMAAHDLHALGSRLSRQPGIDEARATPRTGSLVVRGEAIIPEALELAAEMLGFDLVEPGPMRPLIEEVFEGLDTADAELRRLTRGQFDLASATMVALLGIAAVQIARGRFSAPAITILWYAATTVIMARSTRGPLK
jgi:Heavy metal associated domain 2